MPDITFLCVYLIMDHHTNLNILNVTIYVMDYINTQSHIAHLLVYAIWWSNGSMKLGKY